MKPSREQKERTKLTELKVASCKSEHLAFVQCTYNFFECNLTILFITQASSKKCHKDNSAISRFLSVNLYTQCPLVNVIL